MALASQLKNGMRVKISDSLENSRTKKVWKLDNSGDMLKMQGGYFNVYEIVSEHKIKIIFPDNLSTYLFHPDDLEILDVPEVEPIEFKFDITNLDI